MARDSVGIKQGLKLIIHVSQSREKSRELTARSKEDNTQERTSLVIQWLGLHAPKCRGHRFNPWSGKQDPACCPPPPEKTKTLRSTSFEARHSAQCFHSQYFLRVSQIPFEIRSKIPILQSIVWSCDLSKVTQHYGMEPESQIWFIHTFIQQIFLHSNCMSGSLLNIGEAG